ncbi:hypothetical protein ACFE04_006875 [Oxalis oulophora]
MAAGLKPSYTEASPNDVVSGTFLGLSIFKLGVGLRILVSVFSFVAAVVFVIDKQTKHIYVASIQTTITTKAKFGDIPAFVYFAVTMFVASLYGLITTLASIVVAFKPDFINKLRLHLVLWDVVILGMMAAAIGGAGCVGYIAENGNDHLGWQEVCTTFGKYCGTLMVALFISGFPAIILVTLIMLSFISLNN